MYIRHLSYQRIEEPCIGMRVQWFKPLDDTYLNHNLKQDKICSFLGWMVEYMPLQYARLLRFQHIRLKDRVGTLVVKDGTFIGSLKGKDGSEISTYASLPEMWVRYTDQKLYGYWLKDCKQTILKLSKLSYISKIRTILDDAWETINNRE